MLRFILGIIGILLLIPIALVVVALIIITLVGGYFSFVPPIIWGPLALVALIIIGYKFIKRFFD